MNLLLLLPSAENFDHVYERELKERFPEPRIDSVERHEDVGPFIAHTDVLLTFSPFMADHVARSATRLKWIQVLGSGVDGIVNLPSLRKDVLITSGRGVQATPVSECAFALMLALSRGMQRMVASELWSMPNVLISPHLAGLNTSYPDSILPLVERNIRLFCAGRRHEMINVVVPGTA